MEKDRERTPRGAKRTRKKVCQFCADRVEKIDYKDTAKLPRFFPEELPVPAHTTRENLQLLSREQDTSLFFLTFPTDFFHKQSMPFLKRGGIFIFLRK